MLLSARGLPTVVARCAPAAEGVYRLSVAPTRAAAYAVALSCNGAPLKLPAGCPPPSLRVIAAEPHALGLRAVPPPTGLAPGAPCDEGWHLPLAELDESVGAPGGLPLLPLARGPALVEAGARCQLRVAMVDMFGNPCSAQGAAPSLRVEVERAAEAGLLLPEVSGVSCRVLTGGILAGELFSGGLVPGERGEKHAAPPPAIQRPSSAQHLRGAAAPPPTPPPPPEGGAWGAVLRFELSGAAGAATLRVHDGGALRGVLPLVLVPGKPAAAMCEVLPPEAEGEGGYPAGEGSNLAGEGGSPAGEAVHRAVAGSKASVRVVLRDAWGNRLDANALSEAQLPHASLLAAPARGGGGGGGEGGGGGGGEGDEGGGGGEGGNGPRASGAAVGVEAAGGGGGGGPSETVLRAAMCMSAQEHAAAARAARTWVRPLPDGSCAVSFSVGGSGEYQLTLSVGGSPVRGCPLGVSVAPGPAHALRLRPPPQPVSCGRAHGALLVWAVDALGNAVPAGYPDFEPLLLADDDADDDEDADATGGRGTGGSASMADGAADGGGAPPPSAPPPPPRRPASAHAERGLTSGHAARPASASAAGRRTPRRVEMVAVERREVAVARRARPCACTCITARPPSLGP